MCYQGMKMKQKLSKTRAQEALKKEQTWQNGQAKLHMCVYFFRLWDCKVDI